MAEPKRKVLTKFWEEARAFTEAEIRELLDGGLLTKEQAAQERQQQAAAPAARIPAPTPPGDNAKETAK